MPPAPPLPPVLVVEPPAPPAPPMLVPPVPPVLAPPVPPVLAPPLPPVLAPPVPAVPDVAPVPPEPAVPVPAGSYWPRPITSAHPSAAGKTSKAPIRGRRSDAGMMAIIHAVRAGRNSALLAGHGVVERLPERGRHRDHVLPEIPPEVAADPARLVERSPVVPVDVEGLARRVLGPTLAEAELRRGKHR